MTDSVSITTKITCCDDCPHVRSERHYTSDSWEQVYDWKCALANMMHITYHEWNDGKEPIPKWCPLREEKS
jgi:hypothetical protein